MKKTWILLAILSFCGVMATAQTKETHAFAERDSVLYLDVHRPLKPRDDKAAVIAVFGGGFFTGARDNQYQLALADSLTHRGYTVISIDYRLGLKDSLMVAEHNSLFKLTDLFQYCIDIATEDCADAVAWTIAHASELDIDPSKIVLTGSSAGAITVLQLDYCRANHLTLVSALVRRLVVCRVLPGHSHAIRMVVHQRGDSVLGRYVRREDV